MGGMKPEQTPTITLRPIREDDQELLYRIYAASRTEEMAMTGWSEVEIETFLRMQFRLQHKHYMEFYREATFDVILFDGREAGRLYVDRAPLEIRIVDIAMLPEYRGCGIGSRLMAQLIAESESCGLPLTLHVERYNPAINFYYRLGFEFREDRGIYFFLERPVRRESIEPGSPQ